MGRKKDILNRLFFYIFITKKEKKIFFYFFMNTYFHGYFINLKILSNYEY